MGCGGSNMNPKQKPVPSRLRPILWRRYEDIPGRSNTSRAIGNNDNSKKKPLMIKGGTKEYHSIKGKNNLDPHNTNFQRTHHHEHIEQKVVILPPCSTLSSNNNVGDVDEEKIALNEKNAPLCYNDRMDYEDVKVVKESEKERGLDERKNEEETMSIDHNEMVGASPSFRVYCKTNIDLICEEEYDAKRDSSNLLAHEASFRLLGQMQDADAIPTRESIHNDFSLHPIVGHKAPEALGAIGPKTCESDLCRIEEMKNHGRNDKKPSPYLSSSSSKSKLRWRSLLGGGRSWKL